MTTEQLIILGFLALAFLAGWVARSLVGGERSPRVAGARSAAAGAGAFELARGEVGAPGPAIEPAPATVARFQGAVSQSRDELGRAIRAYHAAVVRTFRNGRDRASGESTLEALGTALVALSSAVDHASQELAAGHPLGERLRATGVELRRLADDVMRHASERELPPGVFDQLEQHLISAASMILSSDRLQAQAM